MAEEQHRTKLTLAPKRHSARDQWEERFRLISWWDSETMAKAKVLIVGAGALGNEVLKNLALLNVGNLFIIDFDKIEYSNLSRSVLYRSTDAATDRYKANVAAERIKDINPNVKVQSMNGDVIFDLGLGVFRRMDVIIGCLDNRVARLHINRYAFKVGKPWIDGALEDVAGQLYVYKPYEPCYECQLTATEHKNIQFRLKCTDIATRNDTAGRIPTTPITASIIGAMQTQEALKIINGFGEKNLKGFKYWGLSNTYFEYEDDHVNPDCLTNHAPIEDIIEMPALSSRNTVQQALELLRQQLKTTEVSINLNYAIVQKIGGTDSAETHDVFIPKHQISNDFLLQYQERPDQVIGILKDHNIQQVDASFPYPEKTLGEIGLPPLQILTVTADKEIYLVEMTGDEDFLNFQ